MTDPDDRIDERRNRRGLLSQLGIVVGAAVGATVVAVIREGQVNWGAQIAMFAGIVVGGGLVALIIDRHGR